MTENEVWLTTEKNRYYPGETIAAILHTEGNFAGAKIRAMLTGQNGKTVALEPIRDGRNAYRLYSEADASGAYTLACDIDNNETQYLCSTCLFVGDCEAEIPKAPAVPVLFVPEMWEEPDYYKLISLYLKNDGKPVPNAPATLIFRNKRGHLKKELHTDGTGNVFFSPYMAGTYCLVSKTSHDNNGDAVNTTVAFSFLLTERKWEKLKKEPKHIVFFDRQL